MITEIEQRWRKGVPHYVRAGDQFVPTGFEVAAIPDDTTAAAFVRREHYSGTYVAARRRFGLYAPRGPLVGVAVFSVPYPKALGPLPRDASVELGRLVLLPVVRGNGESWFVAQCFAALRREGFAGVLSFADPEPRTRADGAVIFGGHLGTIYQALNGVYAGRATPRTLRLLPDGRALNARALQKVRAGAADRGGRDTLAALVAAGAPPPAAGEDPRAWVAAWVPRVTRPFRHRGNHRYLFGLEPAARRALPASQPYPKLPGHLRRAAEPSLATA